jgi:Methane oxygenase PmoA
MSKPLLSVSAVALVGLVLAPLTGFVAAKPAAAATKSLGKVTIVAGASARANTPLTMSLPANLAGKALELRGAGGPLPVTVSPTGAASFVLPRLGKGATARFDLIEAKTPPKLANGVEVTSEANGLVVKIGGKVAFHYRSQSAAPRADVPSQFVRAGYLHPVFTPGGVLVTDDYPADHKHHHGIWTAWTSTEYEGRKPDFWNMGKKQARKDHVALGPTFSGAAAGGFSAKLSSTDLGAQPAKVVLSEDWEVTAYRLPGNKARHFVFDLTWTDAVVGNAPLVLPEYRYGGLGVRGSVAWVDKANVAFLTSEGKDRIAGDGTGARWLHMGGNVEGKPVGLAVLDHPQNFRHPQPLRIHPDDPYFSVAPSKAGKFAIEPGKPYVSRYRFVIADGPADKNVLDRLFDDYAEPPAVTVELAQP